MKKTKLRTNLQNKSLHLWFTHLSNALNDAGLSTVKVLELKKADIPWTPVTVKELLFKQLMEAMYQKTSTTQLTTKELTKVSEVLTRHLAEKLGLQVDWPSIESLADLNRLDNRLRTGYNTHINK